MKKHLKLAVFSLLLILTVSLISVFSAYGAVTAPTNLSGTAAGDTTVNLSWDPVAEANGYNIYRKQSGDFVLIGSVLPGAPATYQDNTAQWVQSYKVSAKDVSSEVYSGEIQVKTDTTGPSAPANLAGSSGLLQNTLTWDASTDGQSGVSGYKIYYRQNVSGSVYSYLTGVTASATSYTHAGLSAGTGYYYYVIAVDNVQNESGQSSGVLVTPVGDTVQPSAPSNLQASSPGFTTVSLSWTPATDNVAIREYKVYRKTGSGTYSLVTTVSSTGYSDSGLTPGTAYEYKVTAVDTSSNESATGCELSSPVTTLPDPTPPSTPSISSAVANSATQVTVTWSAATDNAGIKNYELYRSTTQTGTYTLIATINATSYVNTGLTGGAVYYYKVLAVDVANNKSPLSGPASVTTGTADTVNPGPPSEVSPKATSNTVVEVSWSGATDNVAVTGYDLYRAIDSGTFSKLNTGNITGTSYTDSGLSASHTYKYYVTARDAVGNVSANSETVSAATNGDTQAPSAPGNLSLTVVSDSQVRLSWTASSDSSGVAEYRIYRALESGSFAKITTVTSGTTFTDTGLTNNKTYKYYIKARDAAGNMSDASSTQSAYTSSTGETAEKSVGSSESGTLQINSNTVKLEVPPGSLSSTATYKVTVKSFDSYSVSGYKTLNKPVEMTAKVNSDEVNTFSKDLTVTFSYTTSELGDTPASKLSIYYWDSTNSKWAPVKSTVDSSNSRVTAYVNHFTVFALLADTTAPGQPTISDLSGVTTKQYLTIYGKAEPYAEIELQVNGVAQSAINVDGKGDYSKTIELKTGDNTIRVRAVDAVDNYSSWVSYSITRKAETVLTDISSHWAKTNIEKLLELGITSGYEDGTFRPNRTISRAEFCKFVVSGLGYGPVNNPSLDFKDSGTIQTWARGYVAAAVQRGIISGYSNGTFGPNREITREEMASILIRALKLTPAANAGNTLKFGDSTKIQNWAKGAVATAVSKGLISGYSDNTFGPSRRATRAEAATMIVKMVAIK